MVSIADKSQTQLQHKSVTDWKQQLKVDERLWLMILGNQGRPCLNEDRHCAKVPIARGGSHFVRRDVLAA